MAKPNRPQQNPAQPAQKPDVSTTTSAQRTAPVRPSRASSAGTQNDKLVFGRENFKWMLIGIGIMAVGYVLMSGGAMPSPDVWDENIIYSPLRIIVAPFLILLGLGVEIYAIFKKNSTTEA
jgi:Protein of unknown function (DUF3098)